MDSGEFICPECGSLNAGGTLHLSTVPDPEVPWSSVLKIIDCADCHRTIPAHLAERWDGLTIEAAQNEWREIYRDSH
jgi:hypothetical protein